MGKSLFKWMVCFFLSVLVMVTTAPAMAETGFQYGIAPSGWLEDDFEVVNSFSGPGSRPVGIVVVGDEIYVTDNIDKKVYVIDKSGNLLTSFDTPSYANSSPRDLEYDGTNLWMSESGGDKIIQLDTSGNVLATYDSPGEVASGLAYDGANLWHVDYYDDLLYQMDLNGNIVDQFDINGNMYTDLTYDGEYLWIVSEYDTDIYRIDFSGNVVGTVYKAPTEFTGAIDWDGDDLWYTDWKTNTIYQLRIVDAGSSGGSGDADDDNGIGDPGSNTTTAIDLDGDGWDEYIGGDVVFTPSGGTLQTTVSGVSFGQRYKLFENASGMSASVKMLAATGNGYCGIRSFIGTNPSGNRIQAQIWIDTSGKGIGYNVRYKVRERDANNNILTTYADAILGDATGGWSVGQELTVGFNHVAPDEVEFSLVSPNSGSLTETVSLPFSSTPLDGGQGPYATFFTESYTAGSMVQAEFYDVSILYSGDTGDDGDSGDEGDTGDPTDDGGSGQVGKISILSPSDNETFGYGSTGGTVVFSFSKLTDTAKYLLHLNLYDILTDNTIEIPLELIPSTTPGLSESIIGMNYEFSLDAVTWDVLSPFDITWGIEAYDDAGDLIGSTYSGSTAEKYVYGLKFVASNAIAMTLPSNGANLDKTDSAPSFQWETYQDVATYTLILAHVGSLGFDTVIAKDNLTLNLFPMDDPTWQTMPDGTWYWTVFGYDAAGAQTPEGFTIFDFEVQ